VSAEETENFGVSKLQDFTWKQLLDLYLAHGAGDAMPHVLRNLAAKAFRLEITT
jgi:hypothetical protein